MASTTRPSTISSKAKELDPGLMNARLYLATAYASQYIPGAPSEQNVRLGNAAVNEFKEVLQIDPNILALSMASAPSSSRWPALLRPQKV